MLKPLGAPYRSQTINLGNDQVTSIELAPATDADVEATRKVMGGEDWALWLRALLEAGLLAPGLPHGRLQLHRARADLPDLPLGHDRQGQGAPGGDGARAAAALREQLGGAA